MERYVKKSSLNLKIATIQYRSVRRGFLDVMIFGLEQHGSIN
jgi:hypothetical protein